MIFFLLLTLTVILIYYITKVYKFWKFRGFLQTETSFPFGSLSGFGSKFTLCEGFQQIYNEFKGKAPAVGIYFLFKPCLLALDVELVKNIFSKDFASFQGRGFYTNKEADPTSVQ
jgi:cytochrome P450 family 6